MNQSEEQAERSRLTPLRVVANQCTSGVCPTVYVTGSGTVLVQGFTVPAERAGVTVGDGETLVEVPIELLAEAVQNLSPA
ncbi:hypothetical protein QLQ12_29605 [Actinoplanes sp. NEAU-A12]|uniref:Uncharacterized protein n=1 Tax=Actinoplanes sandaracinus TaxID=3045177 RepID=A0ABT6WSW5_9ACTN|nr:hypothetical protein [Actinoplanes sandaracinus]MDI6102784.1 hypothetical protein [Actinoplanes sandaracinus]